MRAKIKSTGEIVEVVKDGPFYNDIDGYERYYEHELDFQDVISYWDKLLHQYAGMAMQGILARHNVDFDMVVEWSADLAHTLVEKLKKKEERK